MPSSMVNLVLVLICGVYVQAADEFVASRLRRCYSCRSRGELGDCKDPFGHNETSVENIRSVTGVPCASGWCAKIIEGENDEFDTATERMCVQRPPVDGVERCSETIIDRTPVYMCFCLGDLCNGGRAIQPMLSFSMFLFVCYVLIRNRLGT